MADMRRFLDFTGLGIYDAKIKDVISTGDAQALAEAKKYFDDNKGLFEVAGAVATAREALEKAIAAVEAKVDAITDGENIDSFADVEAALAGKQAVGDYATKAEAQAMADGKDEAIAAAQKAADDAQADINAYKTTNDEAIADLEAYVGTLPEGTTAASVVDYVNVKTAGIATDAALEELNNQVSGLQTTVQGIAGNYLKDTDKTELAGDIADVQAAVEAEAATARAAEEANAAAIKAISDNYLKAADKTELQGNIDAVNTAVERLTNGVSADEIDGVNDLIEYVKEHRDNEVVAMLKDISDNASAIEGVAGRMDTAEGKITAVEGAVATKVEKSVYDEKIAALEGADSGLDTRLQAVEAKFGNGEGNVEAQIEAAKTAAIEAAAADAASKDAALKTEIETAYKKYADDEDAKIESRVGALETASDTHALKSDVEALSGKVTTAEGKIGNLETEMEAVKGTVATKAESADLTALSNKVTTAEGKITTLEGEMDAVEGRLDDAEEAIEGKVAQGDFDNLATRVGTAETNIAANTTALAKFVEITETEINSLFA